MNDYWVVIENTTGKVVAHCGDERDAIMMILLKPNRIYKKQKFINDQVITVTTTTYRQLPGQQGLPPGKIEQLNPYKESLPEGKQEPVKI
jgi:hypothetical protein